MDRSRKIFLDKNGERKEKKSEREAFSFFFAIHRKISTMHFLLHPPTMDARPPINTITTIIQFPPTTKSCLVRATLLLLRHHFGVTGRHWKHIECRRQQLDLGDNERLETAVVIRLSTQHCHLLTSPLFIPSSQL